MNTNRIVFHGFSNPDSEGLYLSQWKNERQTAEQLYYNGKQCGGCSFYAPFDEDYGLCCHPKSRHHLETVFEHFSCPAYVDDGWDIHYFMDDAQRQFHESQEKEDVSICRLVSEYVAATELGTVLDSAHIYRLYHSDWPFKLDLGFIAKDNPKQMSGTEHVIAPDLAIKIVTSFDRADYLNGEIMLCLQSGSQQVWVIYPDFFPVRTIHVYSLTSELELISRMLTRNEDILDGGNALPGFRVSFKDIFQHQRS